MEATPCYASAPFACPCHKLQMDRKGRDIDALLKLERDLSKSSPGVERDAKVNLLKYLQVNTVKEYERVSTHLYYDLRHAEGFDKLSEVGEEEPPEGSLPHPKRMGTVEDYLRQAGLAKTGLDELVELVAPRGTRGREGTFAPVKTLESARRKAEKTAGGIHCVTDLARATVVCDTPQDLVDVFELLRSRFCQVRRQPTAVSTHRQHSWGFAIFPFCGTLAHVHMDVVMTTGTASTGHRNASVLSLPLLSTVLQLTSGPGGRHSARLQRLQPTLREEWLQGRESQRSNGRAHLRDAATSPILLRSPERRATQGLRVVPYSQCHHGHESRAAVQEHGPERPDYHDPAC